jgi:AcrR family transcriptional regulator
MEIVKAVGMSAGTFYNYFKDKRDLFEQTTQENVQNLRATLKTLRHPRNPEDINERLERMYKTYNAFFDYVEQNPDQFLMILRGGFGVDEEFDNTAWQYFSSFADDIAEDYEKWQKLGFLKGGNPKLIGHMVIGICLQVAHSYLVDKKFSRQEIIETIVALNRGIFFTYVTPKGKELFREELLPYKFQAVL